MPRTNRFGVALAAAAVMSVSFVGIERPAAALSGSSFDPGEIIADSVFYDGTAMSQASIQQFLTDKVAGCQSTKCLSNGRFSMNSRPADAMCRAVTGGSSLTAAEIIARVGAACGISPKVVLVTLQKEQSLVSGAIARNPSDAVLARAMGYACPDTANGGCDPAYSGVGNQIFWAAWQWKRYGNPPGTSEYFTWFKPGGNRSVQYHPATSCGRKSVYIHNKATAALYYYTPYTPNAAALANLTGTGDACSAYGNRNFWRFFHEWFGSPTGGTTAVGRVDDLSGGVESIRIRGWALDTTTSASTQVHVYVDGKGTPVRAALDRPDLEPHYPGLGRQHGYDVTIAAPAGTPRVCAYAISADGRTNRDLGCRSVTVRSASPFGRLEATAAAPGGVRVTGWTIDADTAAPIRVHVYADGVGVGNLLANVRRPDVERVHPGFGAEHGFDAIVPVPAGTRTVCVYGINTGRGSNQLLPGCRSVRSLGNAPTGSFEVATGGVGSVDVRGWALDGDTAASIPVDVYVGGVGRRISASTTRSDVARVWPAWGAQHGFGTTIPAPKGTHTVCAYAINVGAGAGNPSLGCRTVTVR
jgi:hypothetical protein